MVQVIVDLRHDCDAVRAAWDWNVEILYDFAHRNRMFDDSRVLQAAMEEGRTRFYDARNQRAPVALWAVLAEFTDLTAMAEGAETVLTVFIKHALTTDVAATALRLASRSRICSPSIRLASSTQPWPMPHSHSLSHASPILDWTRLHRPFGLHW